MTAPDKHERRFPTLAIVLCVGMMLPVLYVLSFGPASWLARHSYIDVNAFYVTYWPLSWSCNRCEALSAAVDWYESLWVDNSLQGVL